MKKTILLMAMFMLSILNTKAQMTLQHAFSVSSIPTFGEYAEVVNLSISGKKIAVVGNNIVSFYNLDYSLWKTIPIPLTSMGYPQYISLGTQGTVMYPSEQLFNSDTFLEAAVLYRVTNSNCKIYIINENGAVTDSMTNVQYLNSFNNIMTVYKTAINTFTALVSTTTGVSVYSLPGTIPCDVCGNGLGIAKVPIKSTGISDPMPNPSKGQVKITFTLPEGTEQGEIDLYSINGKLLKTYKVDNTFGFITIDNSEFAAGMYYYNLIADGNITTTKKMVVLK